MDLTQWTESIIERWAWSGYILGKLSALVASTLVPILHLFEPSSHVKCRTKLWRTISFEAIYPLLQGSLLNHERSRRLNALRLLSSKLVEGERDVCKRCLQGEDVSLDVQGVRERVLRIGRVAQVIKDDGATDADVCTRWLIGTLIATLWVVLC